MNVPSTSPSSHLVYFLYVVPIECCSTGDGLLDQPLFPCVVELIGYICCFRIGYSALLPDALIQVEVFLPAFIGRCVHLTLQIFG